MAKVAVIGCGFVGASWAIVFARGGYDVAMYDPSPASIAAAVAQSEAYFIDRPNGAEFLARIKPAVSLEDALVDAFYVQENSPERLALKKSLYVELAAMTGDDTILASSTSGFPTSDYAAHTDACRRCIVSHPINPPHLIPLVELVPGRETRSEVVKQTEALMREVGQTPIILRQEINGFVVNRLQSAVLAEAFKLVEDGVASVEDIDLAMSEGLALRWFFMGPFETIDLNSLEGLSDYCRKLGPMYHTLAQEQAEARQWTDELVAEVEAQRREIVPAEDLEARRSWRDHMLEEFVAIKRKLA